MKRIVRSVWLCCILLAQINLFAQSAKPKTGPVPSWVVKNNFDYSKTSLDKEATEGSLDVFFEAQVSLAEHCRYIRQCKKLISQSGVQNASTVSVSFDPAYQQLTFHSIQIIRNGERLNRLQVAKIKTLHQEEELQNFIYNGSLDAVLILEDVRQGDLVEYSYSIKGFNPVFKDKYAGELSTGFSVPIYDLYYRLIVPMGRTVAIKNQNDTLQAQTSTLHGQQVYEWRKTNIEPLVMQDNTPGWYNPYPRVEISEYKSWKEINDWAMDLFPLDKVLSPAVQKKIAEIVQTCSTDAAKTKAALRFVQDDIRYMGIEMGSNSHKPADPSKVFAQRFGDCKEKSYLLCCMLHAMNIEASPVLINTTVKKQLRQMLPAPVDFDHTTVRVKLDNDYFYFDPTIAYQRGSIKEIHYPDYQAGLVIAAGTTDLTSIPFRHIGYQHTSDFIKADKMSGSGTLVVITQYKGDEADEIRSTFNNQSVAEIMNSNKKFYAKFYEEIKSDSLHYTDNDSTGILTVTEHYTIPDFWTEVKGKGKKFSFSAFTIAGILRRPKEKDRKMPIGLLFPLAYQEDVTVELPMEWNVTPTETHLNNKGFAYNCKFSGGSNLVHLTANYSNQKDFVNTDEVHDYLGSLKEYDDNENYTLSLGAEETEKTYSPNKNNSGSNVLMLLFLIIAVASIFFFARRR